MLNVYLPDWLNVTFPSVVQTRSCPSKHWAPRLQAFCSEPPSSPPTTPLASKPPLQQRYFSNGTAQGWNWMRVLFRVSEHLQLESNTYCVNYFPHLHIILMR
jgi:hypothetical protein